MSTPEMILFEKDPAYVFTDFENKRMRVAAYARVSTDSAEQETSFELQTGYYRKFVGEHPTWTLVAKPLSPNPCSAARNGMSKARIPTQKTRKSGK